MTRKQKKHSPQVKQEKQLKKNYSSFVGITLLVLSALFIFLCFDDKHIQDDAFITFQYVKNFLNGHGLVFNPGEYVEGYTSPLWLFILALTVLFGAEIVQTAQILSVIFGVISLVSLYFLTRTIFSKVESSNKIVTKIFYLIPSLMLALNGAFQYWSISGMETSLFVFLITSAFIFYFYEKKKNKLLFSSLFFMLASLTRPEGWLFYGLTLVHLFLIQKKQMTLKTYFTKKENYLFIIIFFAPNILLLLFRLVYYGYLLPNTFYAKTGFNFSYIISGLNYTWDFLSTYMLFGVILLLIIVTIKNKLIRNEISLLLTIIFVYTLYIIFIGGDVLPIYRFFLPLLPFIFLLFTLLVFEFQHKNIFVTKKFFISKAIPPLLLLLITFYNYYVPKSKIDRYAFYEDNLVVKMSSTGHWLNEYQIKNNKKLTVAATTIGALSYYSDCVIIDMLGLTDKKIAHEPKPITEISSKESGWKERNYDADYILSRNPDFIYFSTGIKPSAYAERALFTKEEFMNYYYAYSFEPLQDFTEVIYKRKEILPGENEFVKFSTNPKFSLDYIELYVNTINIKFDRNKLDEIINNSNKIIEIGPVNFSEPYRLIGAAYGYIDNEITMIENVKKSIEVNNYSMNGHTVLLKYSIMKKDTANIRYHYDILKKLDPDYLIASKLAKVL